MSIKVNADEMKAKLTGSVVSNKHFFVTFKENEDGTYSCSSTYEQVCAALEIGYDVIAVYDGEHARFYANLIYKNEKGVMFGAAYPLMQYGTDAYQMSMHTYMLSSNGMVAVGDERCNLLPPVDADDEDMIMAVYGGTWAMVPMPTGGASDGQITEAVETALEQAKESGEFDGADGKDGSDYVLTDDDKAEIAAAVKASLTTEEWTFTLEDGSTVTKAVYVG